MGTTPRRVLAIDPGLRDLGFAVLDGRRLVTAGVKPLRLVPRAQRSAEARRALRSWIAAYKPKTLILEATYPHPTGSFQRLHSLARDLARVARLRGLRVVAYSPQTVRKALVGDGKCPKVALARVLADRLPTLRVYLTQDRRWKERYWMNMFDAVGLALYQATRR